MGIDFGNLKKSFFVLILIILFVTLKQLYSVKNRKEMYQPFTITDSSTLRQNQPQPKELYKVFHLDLKGAPPKLEFLISVLPIIRQSGANAILIEYEDMFPFSGVLKSIPAANAYSKAKIKRLIQVAESLEMQVIPLVQTFGHLEYVLKLEEFRSLRELDDFPQEICPLNKEAVDLLKEMIKQCMALHPNSKYIHIGCDEVRYVGVCSRCSKFYPKDLFAKHVIKIADFIRSEYPGVTPLIWDDMLRKWTFKGIKHSGLGSAVEPVVWVYAENILTLVPPFIWNNYHRAFPRLWVASAFKGAFNEKETLPDLNLHLDNQLAWMKLISREEKGIHLETEISGIVVTGWSRYDHFAILCELLPVGIPSLILDLIFIDSTSKKRHPDGFSKWLQILRCPPDYISSKIKHETFFQEKLGNCSFPGSNLYSGMVEFQKLRKRVREVTKRVELGAWTSQYNLDWNFTSPWRLLEIFEDEGLGGEFLTKDVSEWKSTFLPLLGQYFDNYTSLEWEEQHVKPLEEKLREFQNFQQLYSRKTWPRRPLR